MSSEHKNVLNSGHLVEQSSRKGTLIFRITHLEVFFLIACRDPVPSVVYRQSKNLKHSLLF